MRETGYGPGGLEVYRVEVEVPDERVLLSEMGLWHVPLNNGYLAVSEEDDDAFDEEARRLTGRKFPRWGDPDFPPHLAEKVLDSWERIFPDRIDELGEYSRGGTECWQACVEYLHPGEIVKEERFILRRSRYFNK